MTAEKHLHGWDAFENGATLDQIGSEGGLIIEDEEYAGGARITLEKRDGMAARFAITCGVYGWFFHTCYCSGEQEARDSFTAMKVELARIVDLLSGSASQEKEREKEILAAINTFVDRFPI
jgi:hypothetical protein